MRFFFLLFPARWNWTNRNGTSQMNKIQIAATHLHSQCVKHLRGSWILLSLSWYVCSYPSTTLESEENPIAWLFCNSIFQSMHLFDFFFWITMPCFFGVEPSTCYIWIAYSSNTYHFFLFDSLLMRLMLQWIGEQRGIASYQTVKLQSIIIRSIFVIGTNDEKKLLLCQ